MEEETQSKNGPGIAKFFKADKNPNAADFARSEKEEEVKQPGVLKVEAAQKVWSKKSIIVLLIGYLLAAYVYSLDGYTMVVWLFVAVSDLNSHSLLSSVTTAQAIIIAVGKPFIAKISDVVGRAEAVALSLFFYVLGYIVIASANGIGQLSAGVIIYALGYTGLQINLQIIIADVTTLRWRALASSLWSVWFFVNAFVAANIAAYFRDGPGWRWGYGMLCIVFPAALAPIIFTLLWAQWVAKKKGYWIPPAADGSSTFERVYTFFSQIDTVGIILLSCVLALILIPTTLAGSKATIEWDNADVLAPMYTIGGLCLPALVYWEGWQAKHPILPVKIMRNRSVFGAMMISFWDFTSFYLQYTYLASFVAVTTGWSAADQNYFLYTQSVALTLFGIIFGAVVAYFKLYKWFLVVGVAIRIIGIGCMIEARKHIANTGGLVMTQFVQGLGGGIASAGSALATQAAVPHQYMAVATAVVLLFAEIGNAVGSAISGAIWKAYMPGELQSRLGGLLNQTAIDQVYSSATSIPLTYPMGSPERDAIIDAYVYVMNILLIVGTCLGLPALLGALMVHDYRAGDTQNAIEVTNTAGEKLNAPEGEPTQKSPETPPAAT